MGMDPEESAAHESTESAEEETREGAEAADTPVGKTNRKRGAKNAKATKAPMDSDCGCGGSAKKMDRNDALTPQEYLAACDLGIQGRSRPYIRARLDAAARLDLKCGNGSISQGEKCHVGAAQIASSQAAAKREFQTLSRDPVAAHRFNKERGNLKGVGNKIKATGEFAAQVGGATAIGGGLAQVYVGALHGNLGEVSRGYRNMTLGSAAIQTANASKASRMGKKGLAKEFLKSAGRTAAIGVGQEAALGAYAGFNRAGGANGVARNMRGAYQYARQRAAGIKTMKRDSVYAAGFTPDLDQLAI